MYLPATVFISNFIDDLLRDTLIHSSSSSDCCLPHCSTLEGCEGWCDVDAEEAEQRRWKTHIRQKLTSPIPTTSSNLLEEEKKKVVSQSHVWTLDNGQWTTAGTL